MRVFYAALLCLGFTSLTSISAQDTKKEDPPKAEAPEVDASAEVEASAADVMQDRQAIAGRWIIARLIVDGKASKPQDVSGLFVVNEANGNWTLTSNASVVAKGTSKIDPTKKPKTIDFVVVGGDNDGKQYKGIYQLGKMGRKMCFAPEGEDRPTRLTSRAGTGHILVEFQKFPEPIRLQVIESDR